MPLDSAGGIVLTCLLASACAGGAADTALSDSMVVDVAAARPPSVAIDEHGEKLWSFGGLKEEPDDELQPGGIPGLIVLPDGNYFMVEGYRVRVFDRDANELWRFGREGAGPAEFTRLGWPCRVNGDTVMVIDQGNRRFAFIKPYQGVVSTVPMGDQSLGNNSCASDNGYLMARRQRDSVRTRVELGTAGTDAVIDTIVLSVEYELQGLVGKGWPMYGMVDTMIYLADPNESVIDLYDRSGRFVRHFKWAAERTPVTDANIPTRYGVTPMGASPEQMKDWWDNIRSRPRADNWPAFVMVMADGRGHLWVREVYEVGADSLGYLVFDPSAGRVAVKVMMPSPTRERNMSILGFVPTGIILMHHDDDGAIWMSVIPYPEPLN